jgi:hypothetical protein
MSRAVDEVYTAELLRIHTCIHTYIHAHMNRAVDESYEAGLLKIHTCMHTYIHTYEQGCG